MPTLATNKKALYDHHVLEEFEAGIVLSGPEVKSAKAGRVNLKGSYVSIDQAGEAWLVGGHIAAYKPAAGVQQNYQPDRRRKLILHKKEIDHLRGKEQEKGLTILPISVYTKGSLVKIKLAVVRGKKRRDKRELIKKRETDREIKRKLKQQR